MFVKDRDTIIVGALLFIGAIYVSYAVTCIETRPLDIWAHFFMAFTFLLGFSYPFHPTTKMVRLLTAMSLLIGLWCTTIISAFVTTMFANIIYLKQISTIDEIINGQLHLVGDLNILEHLRNQNLVRSRRIEINFNNGSKSFVQIPENQLKSFEVRYEHEIEAYLERLLFDSNLAVATSRRQLKSLPIQKKIFCFDRSQNIRTYLRRFFIHSGYPMKNELHTVVERFVETGLVARWQKKYEFQPETERKVIEINSISLGALLGIFATCLGFLFLALVVACVERLIHKKAHCANPKWIYKWTSMMIDNERHFIFFHPENGLTWSYNRNDNHPD